MYSHVIRACDRFNNLHVHAVNQLRDQHLPITYTGGFTDGCWLVQNGYITLYSPSRHSPIFTAEKLEQANVRQVRIIQYSNVLVLPVLSFTLPFFPANISKLSPGLKLNVSDLTPA